MVARMGSPVMRRFTTPVASHRSGVITGWSIVGILAACLCTGLAINYLHITLVRNDALRCAEASALAAGHQLVSDETLRRNQHAFEYDGRISAGRERALTTAAEYQAHSFCPPLAAHQILFETPFEKQGVRLSADQQTVPDRVIVSWSRSAEVSRIPLFMAGCLDDAMQLWISKPLLLWRIALLHSFLQIPPLCLRFHLPSRTSPTTSPGIRGTL